MGLIDIEEESVDEEAKNLEKANWLDEERESILIYGGAKSGKTWAYCSFIEKKIENNAHVFIINTDGGVSKTLKQYFGSNLDKIKGKISYFFSTNMKDAKEISEEIKKKIKPNDLVIIDLLSDFWEMSQRQFIDDVSNGEPINYIIKASKDTNKFGIFAGSMWQYISSLHDYITKPFTARTKCDVIAICAEKDLDIEKKMSGGKSEKRPEYEAIGARPAGQPRLTYLFNTVVYLGKLDQGERHYFQIVGDRGSKTNQKMVSYEKNFIEKFNEERKREYK